MAVVYETMGEIDKALGYLQNALEMNPDQLGIVKMMASMLMKQKQYSQAMDLINALAAKLPPRTKAFVNNLKGEIYMADGQVDKAIDMFSAAVVHASGYVAPRMNIARLMMIRGDIEKALEQYKKVETLHPDYIPALNAIGFIYPIFSSENKKLYNISYLIFCMALHLFAIKYHVKKSWNFL